MKRFLSLVLCALMVIAIVPMTVFAEESPVATFALGANGSASHNDGSEKTTYTETVGGYTLSITGGTKMYTGARDAKGNSALKLGSSSAIGSFKFEVPADVVKVVIYAAKYKAKTSKVDVNGTQYTLSNSSDNGAYDEITVDTSATKTVTFKTVSGAARCMINTIEFHAASGSTEPDQGEDEIVNYTVTVVSEGTTVDTAEIEEGASYTLPAATTKDGFNFVGWTDGANTYAAGESVAITANTTFTAVFEEITPEPDPDPTPDTPAAGDAAATFDFPPNDNASTHQDGSAVNEGAVYTDGNYTLTLTGVSKVYGKANDATGNGALKLGTSDVVGTFTFAVPEDVVKVVIHVAQYKANPTLIEINGEEYTITTASDNGEYTAIEIDTSVTKSITLTTVNVKINSKAAIRCMIDKIEFYTAQPECTMRVGGHQTSAVDAEGKYSVRFVGVLSGLPAGSEKVGFEISAPTFGKAWDLSTNTVYYSLKANFGAETITAEKCGGKYITAAAITGIPADVGAIEFVVTPYVIFTIDEVEVKVYGEAVTVPNVLPSLAE